MIRLITLILIIVIFLCLYYKLNKKQERFQVENTYLDLFLKLIELKHKSEKVNEQKLPQSEIDRVSLRLNNFFSNL
jgi:hypothetical protein